MPSELGLDLSGQGLIYSPWGMDSKALRWGPMDAEELSQCGESGAGSCRGGGGGACGRQGTVGCKCPAVAGGGEWEPGRVAGAEAEAGGRLGSEGLTALILGALDVV